MRAGSEIPCASKSEIPCASKKNLAGESQSAIVHCRPLLALLAVASVAHLRKMPAKNGSAAAPEIAVEPKTVVSCLVECPVRAPIRDSSTRRGLNNHDKTTSGAGGADHHYWDSSPRRRLMPPQHPARSALHRTGAASLQELLARLICPARIMLATSISL